MTPLDPAYVRVLRVRGAVLWLALIAIAGLGVMAGGLGAEGVVVASVAFLSLGTILTVVLPPRRRRAWGYDCRADELHVAHGVLTHVHTVVPFRRVQHIDVSQGPIERRHGVARLILHTAGTHGAIVTLPGIKADQANAMRDAIRAHIRREPA